MEFTTYRFEDLNEDTWASWSTSCETWSGYPFNTPAWIRAAVSEQPSSDETRYLQVVRDGEEIVGFFPYRIRIRSKFRLPLFRYCDHWTEIPPHQWFLLIPGKSSNYYLELIRGLYANLPSWDKCVTGNIQPSDAIEQAYETFLDSQGLTWVSTTLNQAEIRGVANFEDYFAKLSSKKRQQYRKISRELIDTGRCRVVHLHEFDQQALADIKARIVEIYRQSWKQNSTVEWNSILYEQGYRSFSRLLDAFAAINGLHIMVLQLDGDDAAFYVGLHQANTYASFQTAYKETYKKLGIGLFTQIENFRYTIENGYLVNNTLAYQRYKTDIATNHVASKSYAINADTPGGKALLLLSKAKRFIGNLRQSGKS